MEDAVYSRRRKFIINCLYYASIAAIIFVAFRYAIYIIMPFLLAFVVAILIKPIVGFLERRLRLKRSIAAFLITVLFYGTVGVLMVLVGIRLVVALRNLLVALPDLYSNQLLPTLNALFDSIESAVDRLSPEAVSAVDRLSSNVTESIGTFVTDASSALLSTLTRYFTSLPGLLIDVVITIISTFFFTLDYALVTGFVVAQLPAREKKLTGEVAASLGPTLSQYIKGYLLIMVITFLEVFIGLSIVGTRSPALIALLIALFDLMPIVGSGMILFPWTLISLLSGDIHTGIGVGIVWLVVVIMRQVIEPKIVGDQVGLHPIVTLMSMIVGVSLFGGFGLLGLPVTVAIIKRLQDQGTIHLFNEFTPPEPSVPKRKRRGKAAPPPEPEPEAETEAEKETGESGNDVKFE